MNLNCELHIVSYCQAYFQPMYRLYFNDEFLSEGFIMGRESDGEKFKLKFSVDADPNDNPHELTFKQIIKPSDIPGYADTQTVDKNPRRHVYPGMDNNAIMRFRFKQQGRDPADADKAVINTIHITNFIVNGKQEYQREWPKSKTLLENDWTYRINI